MSGFTSGVPEGTHGTHNSRVANAADPRIDSDRDHRAAPLHSSGLEGSHHTTGVHEPAHHGVGTHEGAFAGGANRGLSGPASKTDGPHNSNLLNKADPRVDSDRDHSKNMGLNPTGDATTTTGRTTGNTLGSSTGTHGHTTGNTLGSSTGTHGHTTGNTLGSSTATHGRTTGVPEGTHGTHNSRVANAADPRIDSDRDHRAAHGTTHGTTHGTHGKTGGTHGLGNTNLPSTKTTGPAPNTAGPHKSDLLNKIDPRVDSDLDGSKTVGGDKTHTR